MILARSAAVVYLSINTLRQLLKSYPPENNLRLWCDVFVPVLPSAVATDNWTLLFQLAIADVQNFISSRNKTYAGLLHLTQSLSYLSHLLRHHGNTPDHLQNQHSAAVKDAVTQLFVLWEETWTGETIFNKCLSQLTELSRLLIKQFENDDFLKVFDLVFESIRTDCASVKISTCHFLQDCKKVKFAPDSKQPLIMKKIAMLYNMLLQDSNALVHHTALASFTQFAENTPYETLVPECLGDSQAIQNKVVAFLSKTVEVCPEYDDLTYFRQQYVTVSNHQQQQNTSCDTGVLDDQEKGIRKQQIEVENAGGGDMLDDIEEPALKRKRCQNDKEENNNIQSVICGLEQNICELERVLMSAETVSAVHRNRLKTVCSRLVGVIDKIDV